MSVLSWLINPSRLVASTIRNEVAPPPESVEYDICDITNHRDLRRQASQVVRVAFGTLWSRDDRFFDSDTVLGAINDSAVYGAIGFREEYGTLHINQLAVEKRYQGLKIGRALLRHSLHCGFQHGCTKASLSALPGSEGFYEANDFVLADSSAGKVTFCSREITEKDYLAGAKIITPEIENKPAGALNLFPLWG